MNPKVFRQTAVGNKQKQKSMKKLILGITALIAFSCSEKPQTRFSLNGTVNSIENGTFLYLNLNNKKLDSTKIEDNSFQFNTQLPWSPIRLYIHTKDYSNYTSFWAENKSMTFKAIDTDFKSANITGSKSELLSQALYREIDSLPRKERLIKEMEYVKGHPNSIVSANILSIYSTTWGKEKTKVLFDQFSKENKESYYGRKIERYIELNKEPKIGEQYVDFEMSNQNGSFKKLSEVNGKVVLLEFWASWCGPCRKENPNLIKTYKEFNPKGFEIFAVSLDNNKNSWISAIEEDSLNWEHVSDLKGNENEASLIYGVNGIPDNFLIAENGVIIGRNLRGEELNKKLKELLK